MKVLLTGSTGQVGHALLATLGKSSGIEIVAPVRAQLDLSQVAQIREIVRSIKPDLIINPAAYTAVDLAEQQQDLAHAINAQAPAILAEEARALGIGLIHYSTDYVFDGSKRASDGSLPPYTEQDTTHPVNVYGKTKLAGEQAIIGSGCNYLILRTSWVYSTFGKNFLKTMLRLARERDELRVVNDQWGTPTWAGWIAQATTSIAEQLGNSGKQEEWWQSHGGIYNLTGHGYTTWQGFAKEIVAQADKMDLLGKPAPVVTPVPTSEYPTPASRPANSCLDISRLEQTFKLRAPTWEAALQSCLVAG